MRTIQSRGHSDARPRIHGYTSGVFDMFHIGHLNLLNAATAYCEYLTVAVATDQLAVELKGSLPVIPFLERLEIVQSMSMVDNVVVQQNLDKVEAWRDLGFDIVFAGDNWRGHPRWVATERDLARHGVRTVFLPYTRTTSSEALQKVRLEGPELGA
jgi:glycerol-3-phosphate cytidylyltransferase